MKSGLCEPSILTVGWSTMRARGVRKESCGIATTEGSRVPWKAQCVL